MKKIIALILLMTANLSFATSTQKLTVILDWFPNPDHAPLIVAQQQGFFKEEGLDVTLIGPADPADPPKWIAAGKADIGITYEPEFMEQVDQQLPVVRIGTLINKPLNCLVALKSQGINQLADLSGKKIGSSASGLSSIMLNVMLENAGITQQAVTLITVHYNLTQALLSRHVDAVTGLMRNVEVPQLMSQGIQVFYPEEHGIPNYSELIFIANKNHLDDKRFPHFLAALQKATVYLKQHPEQTWNSFAKDYPEAKNEVNRASWFATIPYFAANPADFNQEEWLRFSQFMLTHKLIKQTQPISRYAIRLT